MNKAAFVFAAPLLATVAACTPSSGGAGPAASPASPSASSANARLMAADGSDRGTAEVTEATDGLHVTVRASGLTPGLHAVHVHTSGSCTAPDFASAGGHWNPTGRQHGKDNPAGMHMGDMPNLLAGADGAGTMSYVIPGGMLRAGAAPLLDADGAAVVIHAQPDDNKSDPAGNAGGRVACGVLTAS